MNIDSKIQFYNALIQWCENIQQELSMSSMKLSRPQHVIIIFLLMSAKIMSELYKAVYTVILETGHDLERKIQFRKYHFLKCGLNKLINVVIENSIWFTMIRPSFRFRINPFKSSKKSQNRNFLHQKLRKKSTWNKFTSSHDKNMTKIYITNYQKSKIIRNFIRDHFQGQLKKTIHWQTLQIQKKKR